MKRYTQRVNVGDTDENADWIKTPENRESERKIHDELGEEFEHEREQSAGQDRDYSHDADTI